jgi:hypothetical protein
MTAKPMCGKSLSYVIRSIRKLFAANYARPINGQLLKMLRGAHKIAFCRLMPKNQQME